MRQCAGACGSRHMGCMGGPAHRLARWVAQIRNASAREHLCITAVRSAYTTASSADVHLLMSLRSLHLVGDHCLGFGDTAVAAARSLCHDHVSPSCPDFGSRTAAPRAQAAREHSWLHIEHLLFDCQCIPGLDSSVASTLLRDDLFRVCSGVDHAEAMLLAAFPSSRVPIIAATACLVPFLLDPAPALGRMSPWHMKLQCVDLVAAFLIGESSAECTRQPPTPSSTFRMPAWSSVDARLLHLQTGCDLPRSACLRLILFCTCPPLCAGAPWPMPVWVWRDVRSIFFSLLAFFTKPGTDSAHGQSHRSL